MSGRGRECTVGHSPKESPEWQGGEDVDRRKPPADRALSRPQQFGRAVLAGVISRALWALLLLLFGGDNA